MLYCNKMFNIFKSVPRCTGVLEFSCNCRLIENTLQVHVLVFLCRLGGKKSVCVCGGRGKTLTLSLTLRFVL